jgi:ribosomal protein S18 acetylase RimI-like enzyme
VDQVNISSDLADLSRADLVGFFVGWPNPPSPETLRRLITQSDIRFFAIQADTGQCVGYLTGLTDHVLFSYLSSVEVLPEYQGRGIGRELVARFLDATSQVYATDLVCDPEVQPFYQQCGLIPYHSMVLRRREQL